MTSHSAIVTAENLTKRYGNFVALRECTLSVAKGKVFGLLGPNGSGKTTFIRHVMGFLRPTAGRVTMDELDCYHHRVQLHRQIAYLPGEARLFPQMTGNGVLKLFSTLHPLSNYQRAVAIARRLDLDLNRYVAFASTGMKQKLALSIVLAIEAPLVILDEPTANLDPDVRATVLELVKEVRKAGRTVILSSHVLSEIEEVCDRVAILRRGSVMFDENLSEVAHGHRIRVRSDAPISAIPDSISHLVSFEDAVDPEFDVINVQGDLAPILPWLAKQNFREMHAAPLGLSELYHQLQLSDSNRDDSSSQLQDDPPATLPTRSLGSFFHSLWRRNDSASVPTQSTAIDNH